MTSPEAVELAAYKAAVARALELIETSAEAFLSTTSNNIHLAASVLRDVHEPTEASDFFEAGRTYTASVHADIAFDCLAISADPNDGKQVGIGWRYGPPHDGARAVKLATLDDSDFACCDWTEDHAGGAR